MSERGFTASLYLEVSIYCEQIHAIVGVAILNLFYYRTVGFVISFSTFLLGCVNYKSVPPDGIGRLSDIIVDHCVSRSVSFLCDKGSMTDCNNLGSPDSHSYSFCALEPFTCSK